MTQNSQSIAFVVKMAQIPSSEAREGRVPAQMAPLVLAPRTVQVLPELGMPNQDDHRCYQGGAYYSK